MLGEKADGGCYAQKTRSNYLFVAFVEEKCGIR